MPSFRGKRKGVRMLNRIKSFNQSGLNISQIARSLGISRNTVRKYLKESLSATNDLSGAKCTQYVAPWSSEVDWNHTKTQTESGVKLAHYWEQNIDTEKITYVSFWREYKRRYPYIPIDMHKVYEPGLRCEYDYKGKDKGFGYLEKSTGELIECRLFGNILCFSQLFYCRATLTERQSDVFDSIARSFEYFDGVPETVGFDNAKAQVVRADNFDADLNPEFSYFCEVYSTAPIAARPRKPKDKNLIEGALGIFWRWAWPQLKRQTFFSLSEINSALTKLCNTFNNRIQRKYGLSRYQKYIQFEKLKLKPLPKTTYFSGEWRKHKPHADCHIQYKYNFYSVPYQCRGKEVDVRISGQMIEVYQDLKRVAIHQALSICSRGRYVTIKSHLPEEHKALIEQTPQAIIEQSERIGLNTYHVIKRLINESRHPLMYLRRCQGIMRLKSRYTSSQLDQACEFFKEVNLLDIKINNIERVLIASRASTKSPGKVKRKSNENLRGQSQWAETFH